MSDSSVGSQQPCTYIIEACAHNHCCHGKAICITYSECVFVASVIQHAKRICCKIVSSVTCVTVPYFSHYLINGKIFRKTLPNIKCVMIFSTTSVRNISHSKKNSARQDHKCIQVFM